MILYRIEPAYAEFSNKLIPKIPRLRMKGEDAVTPRVCVAQDIDGCIWATPYVETGSHFNWHIFRVFEFEINEDDKDLVLSSELYEEELVPDALDTGECWIKRPIEAVRCHYITGVHLHNGMAACYEDVSEEKLAFPDENNKIYIDISRYLDKNYEKEDIKDAIDFIKSGFDDYGDTIYGITIEGNVIILETKLALHKEMFISELIEELKTY